MGAAREKQKILGSNSCGQECNTGRFDSEEREAGSSEAKRKKREEREWEPSKGRHKLEADKVEMYGE